HDTLLNALSGALLIRCIWRGSGLHCPDRALEKSGVVGQPQSRELPAVVWIEEVAIGNTAVAVRSCKRGAPPHQLVDRELAVVFAERALDGAIAGVGGIGAAGPLPDDAEGVVELTCASGDFPFHFGRQMAASPARERIRLVIADMADGRVGVDRP